MTGARRVLPLLALSLVCAFPAAAAPDAITFTISHADCGPSYHAGDNRFRLFLNETRLAEVPTTVAFAGYRLVVTITDPADLLALFDPATCNSFRVEISRAGAPAAMDRGVDVGDAGAICLFDGSATDPHPSCCPALAFERPRRSHLRLTRGERRRCPTATRRRRRRLRPCHRRHRRSATDTARRRRRDAVHGARVQARATSTARPVLTVHYGGGDSEYYPSPAAPPGATGHLRARRPATTTAASCSAAWTSGRASGPCRLHARTGTASRPARRHPQRPASTTPTAAASPGAATRCRAASPGCRLPVYGAVPSCGRICLRRMTARDTQSQSDRTWSRYRRLSFQASSSSVRSIHTISHWSARLRSPNVELQLRDRRIEGKGLRHREQAAVAMGRR